MSSDHEGVSDATKVFVEQRLRETRHELRNDIQALAVAHADAALQATREHGEVRSEIQAVRNEVAGLRHDLAEVLPLRETVAGLQRDDELEEARRETERDVLKTVKRQRAEVRVFMLGVASLLVGMSGWLAFIAPHSP